MFKWIAYLKWKYESWRASKRVAQACKLDNGEIIIKDEEEGVYFLALDEHCVPLLIDEDEGERLWKQGKPI